MKIAKRISAFIITVVLALGMMPVPAFAEDEPQINENGYYVIGTAEELMWFAKKVNSGEDSINAELTANIDLSAEEWQPIGYETTYCGSFKGNGFKVTLNAQYDESCDYFAIGFFAYLSDAKVENLKIDGSITVSSESYPYVGGLAGGSYGAEIKNCVNNANITVTAETTYVGGLIGADEGGRTTISYCANRGNVTAEETQSVGGILGSSIGDTVKISYSYNSASISGSYYTGGIVGDGYFNLNGCYSSAGIEDWGAPGSLEMTGSITGGKCGDLAGYTNDSGDFENSMCYTEVISGCTSYNVWDCKNCKTFGECDEASEIIDVISVGSEDGAFVIDEKGFGDGWPVLAWELKGGATSEERDKELIKAKEEALKEIDSLFEEEYKEENYEESDWNTITGYRDRAQEAINNAKDVSNINAALKSLKTDLAAVPTAQSRLDDYKKAAAAEVEKAYFYQKVYTYSTEDTGYKAELTKYIDEAGKFGLQHSLKDELLGLLDEDMNTLAKRKEDGISKINLAASKSEVDAHKSDVISEMQRTLEEAKARSVDNGVEDKWDGTTTKKPEGSGNSQAPYIINTAEELAWFSAEVNAGKYKLCAVLMQDIDLNGKDWTPIAKSADNSKAFSGIFDGNGHTVHGIYVNVTKESAGFCGGLFGNIGKNGVVKSVGTAGVIKQELGSENLAARDRDKYAIGGIAGRTSGIIYNCESSVALTNGKKYSYCNYFGGIAGKQFEGNIEGCRSYAVLYMDGTSNFQTKFGGVTGASVGTSLIRYTDSYANIDLGENVLGNIGGIMGTLSDTAQIRECRNFGKVHYGSGIAGDVLNAAGITYVKNSGSISGSSGLMVNPGAGIAGNVETTGKLSYLNNDGKSVYGIINDLKKGTVSNAVSVTEAPLWNKVDIQHSTMEKCIRADELEAYENTKSQGALGDKKLQAARTLLSKMKTDADSVYGNMSGEYNDVILRYLRKTELAKSVEEVDGFLSALDEELALVKTQLEVEKLQALSDFNDFISSRVYDDEGESIINGVKERAQKEVAAAATLKQLNSAREKYLGTDEQPGLFETSCDTYNTKAKNELYNEFIYDKTYSSDDTARIISCYEKWAIKLDNADSREKIEAAFADARKELNDLCSEMTETGIKPDLDEARAKALEDAKISAKEELDELYKKCCGEISQLLESAKDKGFQEGFTNALNRIKDAYDVRAAELADVDFSSFAEFVQIENALNEAKANLEEYTKNTEKRIEELINSAEESTKDAWDGKTLTEPKTLNGIYQISNGAELAWLANRVNGTYGEVSAILTADIDLAYHEWTPIGQTPNGGRGFKGVFDGNGHTVKGLYISKRSEYGYYGFIGVIREDSVVKNLNISGEIELSGLTGKEYVGGLAALCYNAEIKNCCSLVNIRLKGTQSSGSYYPAAGGIIGLVQYSSKQKLFTAEDCEFKGYLGLSDTKNNREPQGVGGIVGRIDANAQITRCINSADIAADKALGAGGIVGFAKADSFIINIKDCANLASVANDADNVMESKGSTGGILGTANSDDIVIDGCYNTGEIIASKLAGGILGGESYYFGSSAGVTGSKRLVVKNCYSAGKITGPNNESSNKIGSVAGYPLDGEYKENVYALDASAQSAFGWISSKGDFAKITDKRGIEEHFADGVNMVKSIANLNGGYPLYAWQLLKNDNRNKTAAYIREYFEKEIEGYATSQQKSYISEETEKYIDTVKTAASAEEILEAYYSAMNLMNKEELLKEAREKAIKALNEKAAEFKGKYAEYEEDIEECKKKLEKDIDEALLPSQAQAANERLDSAVVETLINAIGEINEDMQKAEAELAEKRINAAQAEYDLLSEQKKNNVNNFVKLIEAKEALQAFNKAYAENMKAAKEVEKRIDEIGEVSLESKKAIDLAYEAYEKLTDKQRSLIEEKYIKALIDAKLRYEELLAAYNKDAAAVKDVTEKINSIGKVTLEAKEKIENAKNAYNALTESQKNMLSKSAYDTLFAALDKIEALLKNNGAKTDVKNTEPQEAEYIKPEENIKNEDVSQLPDNNDENKKNAADGDETEKPAQSGVKKSAFDITVIWIICGILLAAAASYGIIRWFIAAKKNKRG